MGLPGALVGSANTAVGFDGLTEHVQVPYAAALNGAQFTVEAWAFVTGGQGTSRSVVTSRDSATGNRRGFALYADNNNVWSFWLGTGTDVWHAVFGPSVVLNTWTHLVATFDGSTARLYVNGVLVGSLATGYATNAVRPLRIATGTTEGAPNFYFPGMVDEVAMYTGALADTRIQAHYVASGR